MSLSNVHVMPSHISAGRLERKSATIPASAFPQTGPFAIFPCIALVLSAANPRPHLLDSLSICLSLCALFSICYFRRSASKIPFSELPLLSSLPGLFFFSYSLLLSILSSIFVSFHCHFIALLTAFFSSFSISHSCSRSRLFLFALIGLALLKLKSSITS